LSDHLLINKHLKPKAKRWRSFPHRFAFWIALACAPVLGSPRTVLAESNEYQLKAAFIYNFTKFVDWPDDAFADATSPIVIGVLGKDPFSSGLEEAIRDRKAHNRSIVVRQLATPYAAHGAQLIFVSADESNRLNELSSTLRGTHTLIVTEFQQGPSKAGAINFVLDGDKLRFEINMDEANAAGIKISAQLQKLATTIYGRSRR
jgi:hypothetical protein